MFKGFIFNQGIQQSVVKGMKEVLHMNAKLPSTRVYIKSNYNTKPYSFLIKLASYFTAQVLLLEGKQLMVCRETCEQLTHVCAPCSFHSEAKRLRRIYGAGDSRVCSSYGPIKHCR